jgi:nitrate reductase gamma subunit
MRHRIGVPLATAVLLAAPSMARASDGAGAEPVTVTIGVITLLASIVLLLISLGLARVAAGSAMADNISYVVAACVCLAGSVLAGWSIRFAVDGAVAAQIALGSSALTAVSIVLFCVYFYRVRAALQHFLKAVSGEDTLARAQGPGGNGDLGDA